MSLKTRLGRLDKLAQRPPGHLTRNTLAERLAAGLARDTLPARAWEVVALATTRRATAGTLPSTELRTLLLKSEHVPTTLKTQLGAL